MTFLYFDLVSLKFCFALDDIWLYTRARNVSHLKNKCRYNYTIKNRYKLIKI